MSWVGTAKSQNTKDRMEDEVVARTWKGGGLFAVLDGHNGRTAVEFAALHLPQ
jgi:serine/threonine protein phosphatase PrpC